MNENNILLISKMEKKKRITKTEIYRNVKKLAEEQGFNITVDKKLWRTKDRNFWVNREKKYLKDILNRNNNHKKALKLASKDTPLRTKLPLKGTSYDFWRNEVQYLQRKIRTNHKKSIKEIKKRPLPFLKEIKSDELKFKTLLSQFKFQKIINRVLDGKILTNQQAIKFLNTIKSQAGKYVLDLATINGIERTVYLNDTIKDFMMKLLTQGQLAEEKETFNSDALAKIVITQLKSVIMRKLNKPKRVIPNKAGKFFDGINTTKIDLTQYQIYTQDDAYDSNKMSTREHCMIHSLLECGVSESYCNSIKLAFTDNFQIKKKDIKKVANIIERNITIYSKNSTSDKHARNTTYKSKVDKGFEAVKIALYEDHYFVYNQTEYSSYSINNYDEVCNEDNFKNIVKKNTKGNYTRNNSKSKINSLLLVDKFFNQGKFKKLDMSLFSESSTHKNLKDHIYLNNIENEQRECVYKAKSCKYDYKYFADCETIVNKQVTDHHELYMIGVVGEKDDKVDILTVGNDEVSGQMSVYNFLSIITDN